MGTSTTVNSATDSGPWRSNETTRTGPDPRHNNADTEPRGASGNAASESDQAAGSYYATRANTITNASGWNRARWIDGAFARTEYSAVSGEAVAADAESFSFRHR